MKVTWEIQEVRSDIKRRIVGRVKEELGRVVDEWGFIPPVEVALRYDVGQSVYYVRVTFSGACVDWLVDEDGNAPGGIYQSIGEQLAGDARIPIAEEL